MSLIEDLGRAVRRPLFMKAVISAFLYLLLVTSVFGMLGVDASVVIDLRVFVSAKEFDAALAGQSELCRDCYLVFHLIDLLFIINFYPLLASFAKRLCPSSPLLVMTSLGAGLMDLLENVAIDWALLTFPGYHGWLFHVVRLAMPLKFALLACSLAGMLLCRAISWLKRSRSR